MTCWNQAILMTESSPKALDGKGDSVCKVGCTLALKTQMMGLFIIIYLA